MKAATAALLPYLTDTVQLEPAGAGGTWGDSFGPAVPIRRCLITHKTRDVVGPGGVTVTTSTRVTTLLEGLPDLPVGSRVTLPASHGGATRTLVGVEWNVTGPTVPTPDHVVLVLD